MERLSISYFNHGKHEKAKFFCHFKYISKYSNEHDLNINNKLFTYLLVLKENNHSKDSNQNSPMSKSSHKNNSMSNSSNKIISGYCLKSNMRKTSSLKLNINKMISIGLIYSRKCLKKRNQKHLVISIST